MIKLSDIVDAAHESAEDLARMYIHDMTHRKLLQAGVKVKVKNYNPVIFVPAFNWMDEPGGPVARVEVKAVDRRGNDVEIEEIEVTVEDVQAMAFAYLTEFAVPGIREYIRAARVAHDYSYSDR